MDWVKLATIPDWITPTIGIIQDIANGPSETFVMAENAGHSGREVEALLKARGVKSWGWMGLPFPQDGIMFSVSKRQASWARYILSQNGVTLTREE